MKKVTIKVEGISCAMCAKSIEGTLSQVDGASAQVNVSSSKVTLKYDESKHTLISLCKLIEQAGYKPILKDDDVDMVKESRKELYKIIISALLTLPLLWTMWHHLRIETVYVPPLFSNPLFQFLLATPVQFIIGYKFYRGAWYSIKSRNLGMDVLVAVGTTAAYVYSIQQWILFETKGIMPHLYFESSATIITVILLGNYFESRVKARTQETLKKLIELSSSDATVIRDNKEVIVDISEVQIGDIIVVKQGEKIPIDGVVIDGVSHVNEAMISGEPLPKLKEKNSEVIGGTVNVDATLKIKAEKVGEDTVLAHIIQTVEEAQLTKPKIHRTADKIANYFVPTVITISLISFIVWYFIIGEDFTFAFSAAVSVLVISCPCALGLATPTSIMVGSGRAAEYGILYHGGEFFEIANKINAICFDKTGTITEGRPTVEKYYGEKQYFKYIYALEKHSNHPIASAICQYIESEEAELIDSDSFSTTLGRGISGIVEGKEVYIGSLQYMKLLNIEITKYEDDFNKLISEGKTVIFVAVDCELVSMISIFDKIRDNAREVILELHENGIDTYMITGDNELTARYIAEEVGIKNVYHNVLPTEKREYVLKIQQEGKVVGFIGDGINDGPALKTADVGIAMGGGTDIAISSSDITLMNDDLSSIIKAIKMSKITLKNIYQNFFWAFIYNVVAIPFAAAGQLNPMIAAFAMAFSDVTVVFNALRLKGVKLDKKKEVKADMKVKVPDMACNHCVMNIVKALNAIGVEKVNCDVNTKEVTAALGEIPKERAVAAIQDAGYTVE